MAKDTEVSSEPGAEEVGCWAMGPVMERWCQWTQKRDILQNKWPKIIKERERLENCSRLKETEVTYDN